MSVPVPTADAATTITGRPSWPHPLPTTPRKPVGRSRLAWSVALVVALIAAVVVTVTLTRSDGGTPAAGRGSTPPTTSGKIITTTSSTTVQTSVFTEETPPPLSEGSAHGIVPQLPIPSPAQTSIRPDGHVGSFSLATGDGIGFCNYAENRTFTGFVINPPEAALRTAWAHTSAGQFVQFDEVLQGFDKSWHTLRTLSRSTQVGQTLTALPRLAQFPISSSWTGRYATFRVIEKLTWLRPTDNVAEGSVTAPIGPCAATQ